MHRMIRELDHYWHVHNKPPRLQEFINSYVKSGGTTWPKRKKFMEDLAALIKSGKIVMFDDNAAWPKLICLNKKRQINRCKAMLEAFDGVTPKKRRELMEPEPIPEGHIYPESRVRNMYKGRTYDSVVTRSLGKQAPVAPNTRTASSLVAA